MKEITKSCDSCGGLGYESGESVDPPGPVQTECKKCAGTGILPHGQLSDDLIDMLNDMNNKINDIFEKVNEQEKIMKDPEVSHKEQLLKEDAKPKEKEKPKPKINKEKRK